MSVRIILHVLKRTSLLSINCSLLQIELDLLRTLPNNKHYDSPHADGVAKLRRVLLAYSVHSPEVEYCQVGWRARVKEVSLMKWKVSEDFHHYFQFKFKLIGVNLVEGKSTLFCDMDHG